VFIHHPQKLEDWDLREALGARGDPIHVLVPILVIDELDGLKRDAKRRGRAQYTLAVIDRLFQSSTTGTATLRERDFSGIDQHQVPYGEVSIELVFDPSGHVRQPINDDEIIDRTLAIQAIAARDVTLLTYDTGQSLRARAAGLRAIKLRDDSQAEAMG
jgi:predicted ribonuclease YlaK